MLFAAYIIDTYAYGRKDYRQSQGDNASYCSTDKDNKSHLLMLSNAARSTGPMKNYMGTDIITFAMLSGLRCSVLPKNHPSTNDCRLRISETPLHVKNKRQGLQYCEK